MLLLSLNLGGCFEKADVLQEASSVTYSERREAVSILSAPERDRSQDASKKRAARPLPIQTSHPKRERMDSTENPINSNVPNLSDQMANTGKTIDDIWKAFCLSEKAHEAGGLIRQKYSRDEYEKITRQRWELYQIRLVLGDLLMMINDILRREP